MGQSYLQKPVSPNGPDGGPVEADAGAWQSVYPALSEFLAATRWSDGTPRVPGTLTLFTDGPQWKLCLSDKDQSRLAFVSGSSPQAALLAAEAGLVGSTLDWRAQKGIPGKGNHLSQ